MAEAENYDVPLQFRTAHALANLRIARVYQYEAVAQAWSTLSEINGLLRALETSMHELSAACQGGTRRSSDQGSWPDQVWSRDVTRLLGREKWTNLAPGRGRNCSACETAEPVQDPVVLGETLRRATAGPHELDRWLELQDGKTAPDPTA